MQTGLVASVLGGDSWRVRAPGRVAWPDDGTASPSSPGAGKDYRGRLAEPLTRLQFTRLVAELTAGDRLDGGHPDCYQALEELSAALWSRSSAPAFSLGARSVATARRAEADSSPPGYWIPKGVRK